MYKSDARAEKEWGDGIRGLSMSAARYALFHVDEAPPHTKNWRPQLLAFVNVQKNDEEDAYSIRHARMFNFLYQLKAGKIHRIKCQSSIAVFDVLGRGFVVAASILEGDYMEKYQHLEPVRQVSFINRGSARVNCCAALTIVILGLYIDDRSCRS